jgi:hypothetical protein
MKGITRVKLPADRAGLPEEQVSFILLCPFLPALYTMLGSGPAGRQGSRLSRFGGTGHVPVTILTKESVIKIDTIDFMASRSETLDWSPAFAGETNLRHPPFFIPAPIFLGINSSRNPVVLKKTFIRTQ